MTARLRLHNTTEEIMISHYDHINELRAELRSCYLSSPQERAEMTAELDQALARQAELDRDYANGGG
jgi:type VI protein secretion system component VasK